MKVTHQQIKEFEKFTKKEKDRLYILWRESGMDIRVSYKDFCVDYLIGEKYQAALLRQKGKKK